MTYRIKNMKQIAQPAIARKSITKSNRRGIASLPVILLLGGVILEVGIAGAFLLVYLNNSIYGTRLANEALEASHSGINDAILRTIVDKDCGGSSATCPGDPYTLSVGRATAQVTICKDTCTPVGQTKITSLGRIFTKQHTLVAILNVSSTTGWVTVESIEEENQ
jgi:hypothetical protein